MNGADIAILAVLAFSMLFGLLRGFVSEVLSLVCWVAAFWAAWMFGDRVAAFYGGWLGQPTARIIAGYVTCFLGVLVVGAILALLMWGGRTIPTAAIAASNRVVLISAVLMVVTLLLNRLLPVGFSGWVVLTGLLPALPFLYLAWRVARA